MKSNVKYWLDSAEHDFDVVESLYQNAKYDWCLFIAHIVLEKLLKACYAKYKDAFPPRTHDLVKLADSANIEMDDTTLQFLDKINTFNISVRYPDEKMKFYKLCTKEFATDNLNRIKEIRKCLLKKIEL